MRLIGLLVAAVTVVAHKSDAESSSSSSSSRSGRQRRDGRGQSNEDSGDEGLPRPVFRTVAQNFTVSPGERASLKCRVDHLGTKTVIWRKQNDNSPLTIGSYPFAADARISVDYNMRSSEWTLLIQDVRTTDEGLYICQVSTKDASEHMFTVQLNVKTIQVSGMNVVESGTRIELYCNATGRHEPPHNVDWIKDGRTVHSDVQRGLIVTKKIETKLLVSVLTIQSSRQSDAGDYMCLSSDMESASVNVIVVPVPANVGKRGTNNHRDLIVFGTSSTPALCPTTSSRQTRVCCVVLAAAATFIVTMMTATSLSLSV